MDEGTIGIKVADGTYYPILSAGDRGRRKVILAAARDDQTSVHIDLYEGAGEDAGEARYVGSLLIDKIVPAEKGQSEIELVVGIEGDGRLTAQAKDLSSGESQSLDVSLESRPEEDAFGLPDFELEDTFLPDSDSVEGESSDEDNRGADLVFSGIYDEEDESPGNDYAAGVEPGLDAPVRRGWAPALFIIVGVAAVAALAVFIYILFQGPELPPLRALFGRRDVVAERVLGDGDAVVAEVSRTEAPAAPDTERGPEVERATPPTNTPEERAGPRPELTNPDDYIGGVWYWIRWGDTLWGISRSFYRTPWMYGAIAQYNEIRNPDRILAGARIFIPKKE